MKLHMFDSLIYQAAAVQYEDVLIMDSLLQIALDYSLVIDSLFTELEYAEDEQDSTDIFEQLDLFSDSLGFIDSTLYSNDTSHLSTMNTVKNSSQQILNYLSPTGDIETNEKAVRQLQLDLVFPQVVQADSTQLADLYALSNLCPNSHGSLVFLARSINAHYKPEVLFDDEDLCEEESELISKNKDQIPLNSINLKITPNPSQEWIELEWRNDKVKSEPYDILIFDVMGTPIYSLLSHKESNTKVNTSEWPTGIYRIQILSDKIPMKAIPFIKL
ncbi:MAG: hypothetical protein IPM48_02225 [Saprospiraceae bacterium]|nr:hypothetical protein [Saprospiraceae bacterium]